MNASLPQKTRMERESEWAAYFQRRGGLLPFDILKAGRIMARAESRGETPGEIFDREVVMVGMDAGTLQRCRPDLVAICDAYREHGFSPPPAE